MLPFMEGMNTIMSEEHVYMAQWAEKGVHAILGSQEALLVNLGPS